MSSLEGGTPQDGDRTLVAPVIPLSRRRPVAAAATPGPSTTVDQDLAPTNAADQEERSVWEQPAVELRRRTPNDPSPGDADARDWDDAPAAPRRPIGALCAAGFAGAAAATVILVFAAPFGVLQSRAAQQVLEYRAMGGQTPGHPSSARPGAAGAGLNPGGNRVAAEDLSRPVRLRSASPTRRTSVAIVAPRRATSSRNSQAISTVAQDTAPSADARSAAEEGAAREFGFGG